MVSSLPGNNKMHPCSTMSMMEMGKFIQCIIFKKAYINDHTINQEIEIV